MIATASAAGAAEHHMDSPTRSPRCRAALLVMLAVALLWPGLAYACTASVNLAVVNLGSYPSTLALSGTSAPGTGRTPDTFSFTCSGSLLAVGATPSLSATLSALGSGSGVLKKAGEPLSIPYELASAASGGTLYSVGSVLFSSSGNTLLSLLDGGISVNAPIYLRAALQQNLSAGDYTDTISVTWQPNNICEGIALLGACVGTLNNAPTTTQITLTVHIERACSVSSPDIDFGSAIVPSQFGSIASQVQVLCTKGSAYTVGIGAGLHTSGGQRRMQRGSNNDFLAYDLYKPGNVLWSSLERVPGIAVGDGVTLQSLLYSAAIYPGQPTPAAGVYGDSIVIDVAF
jgi:spore coat protein U-like protein